MSLKPLRFLHRPENLAQMSSAASVEMRKFTVDSASTANSQHAVISLGNGGSYVFEFLIKGVYPEVWQSYTRGGITPTLNSTYPQLIFNEINVYRLVPVGTPPSNGYVEFKEVASENDDVQPFTMLAGTAPVPPPAINYEHNAVYYTLVNPSGVEETIRCTTIYDIASSSATPLSTSYYNETTGAPYVGATANLSPIAAVDMGVLDADWCAGGVAYVAYYQTRNGIPTGIITWLNTVTGAFSGTIPVGATHGVCIPPAATPLLYKTYSAENVATASFQTILAATGGLKLISLSVKQQIGVGTFTGDTGTAVSLHTGEFWSWAASSENGITNIADSSGVFTAGTGIQKILAVYSI